MKERSIYQFLEDGIPKDPSYHTNLMRMKRATKDVFLGYIAGNMIEPLVPENILLKIAVAGGIAFCTEFFISPAVWRLTAPRQQSNNGVKTDKIV